MRLKATISLIVFLFVYVKAETCPPESLVRPCECFPEVGLTLECRKINDASVLDGISRRTGNVTFHKFRLFNSSMESLPSNILMKKQFQAVEIYDSRFHSLIDGLDKSNNIRSFDLVHVGFSIFSWSQFKPLEKIFSFKAVRTFIPEIGDEFKNNMNKNLAYLILSHTDTKYISDGALSAHEELRGITIENCGVKSVQRSIFPRPAANLFQLILDGNAIRSLPDDIFEDMPNLELISLKQNKLSMISEAVFKSMGHQPRSLYLDENPLKCDCNIKWVVSSSYKPQYDITGKCHSGLQELRDKELTSLKSEDFQSCH